MPNIVSINLPHLQHDCSIVRSWAVVSCTTVDGWSVKGRSDPIPLGTIAQPNRDHARDGRRFLSGLEAGERWSESCRFLDYYLRQVPTVTGTEAGPPSKAASVTRPARRRATWRTRPQLRRRTWGARLNRRRACFRSLAARRCPCPSACTRPEVELRQSTCG